MTVHRYLATCPTGVGVLLTQELQALGAEEVVERPVGVSFCGDLALGYRVCVFVESFGQPGIVAVESGGC